MSSTKAIALAAAAMAFTAIGIQGASSEPRGHGYHTRTVKVGVVNARIARQSRRIRIGRHSGRLNRVEARTLRSKLAQIRTQKRRYMRDGWLNRREARNLDRMLDTNSRRIRRLATNGHRGWRQWRRGGGHGRVGLGRLNGFQG